MTSGNTRTMLSAANTRHAPASALAGACLVLAADSIVRVLPLVTELRLGIALSLIGAPFFGWLLLRMRRGRL